MRAAVCREFNAPFQIEEVTLAEPAEGEVLVEMRACAICHSDVTFAKGDWGGTPPIVLGHEAAGVIAALGPGVRRLSVGQRVIVTLVQSCGACACCAQSMPGSCTSTFPRDETVVLRDRHGGAISQGLRTAAFAERTVVDASQVVPIREGLSFEDASLLACGVLTGYGAVANSAKLPPGATAAVIGAGGVGLNSVQAARISGAARIFAIDVKPEKLAVAEAFGATDRVNAAQGDPVAAVRKATRGFGVDYVFVTAGVKAAVDQAMRMVARGGAVVLVGMPPNGVLCDIDPGTIANDCVRIIGSKMGAANIHTQLPALMDLHAQGCLQLAPLISNRFAFDEINAAMASSMGGAAIRNVMTF